MKWKVEQHSRSSLLLMNLIDLPLVDLNLLNLVPLESEECKRQICDAASNWGFLQLVNHGISSDIVAWLRSEQVKLFRQPFNKKANEKLLNLPSGSYRWGTQTASTLMQFSWSEAFHIPLVDMQERSEINCLRFVHENMGITCLFQPYSSLES